MYPIYLVFVCVYLWRFMRDMRNFANVKHKRKARAF